MSNSNIELTAVDPQLATREPSVGGMLAAFIERGITADNVSAFGQLCELREKMEAREAERAFAAAFVELQRDIPRVKATKIVMNKDGNTIRYRFAPFEEILLQTQPMLSEHGFSISFNSRIEGSAPRERMVVICTLTHRAGHSRQNEFANLIGDGPPGSSKSQIDGSANSYAKRFALINALNIVVASDIEDDDAGVRGEVIDAIAAAHLQDRVKQLGANEASFLAFAGAESFDKIALSRLDALHELLDKKQRQQQSKEKA